jgi:hypothetical protein
LSLWGALVLAWFAGAQGVVDPARAATPTPTPTTAGASARVDRDGGDHAAVVEAAEAEAEAESADAESEAVPLTVAGGRIRASRVAIAVLRTLILPGAIAPRDGPTVSGCCVASRRWAPEGAQGPPLAA